MISRVLNPINSASATPTSLYFYFIFNISHIRYINFIINLSDNIITKSIILKKKLFKINDAALIVSLFEIQINFISQLFPLEFTGSFG